MMAMPPVVDRKQWGAKPPRNPPSHNVQANKGGWAIHHTGSASDAAAEHKNCAAKVRGIQAFHMGPERRWNDIAYSFLVCKHGYIYRGRNWGVRSAAQGTNDGNNRFLAICYLGLNPSAKAYATIKWLVNRGRDEYGLGREVRPHSYFHSTSCPGDPTRKWIKDTFK